MSLSSNLLKLSQAIAAFRRQRQKVSRAQERLFSALKEPRKLDQLRRQTERGRGPYYRDWLAVNGIPSAARMSAPKRPSPGRHSKLTSRKLGGNSMPPRVAQQDS